MTSLFLARRSAEEFAAAVDGAPPSTHVRAPESESLLALVGALRAHEPIRPRAAFSDELRERLMTEAETALQPATGNLRLPTRERGPRERRLAVAASAFVLIGGATTMGAAAQSSLPGEALYPIKRGIERADAQLNTSSAGKGRDLLGQASDRLAEVEGLLGVDADRGLPRVPETLAQFSSSATEGADLLFESYRETGDPTTVAEVRDFTTEGIAKLEELSSSVPASAQPDLTAAAIALRDLDAAAIALCSGCAPGLPEVEIPDVLLARAEVDRALVKASAGDLDNNHPVVVPPGLSVLIRPDGGAARERPAPTGAAAPTTPLPSSAPSALPSPTLTPKSWPSLTPKRDEDNNTRQGDSGAVEDLTKDITKGLTGVVETLLPDLGGGDGGLLP